MLMSIWFLNLLYSEQVWMQHVYWEQPIPTFKTTEMKKDLCMKHFLYMSVCLHISYLKTDECVFAESIISF